MSETLKFGNGQWAVKEGSALAYNSESGNFKPLPFTFDRSTSATRVNKEGLIEVVSNNEPRIDFLNDIKGALKLEPSKTNYILKSDDILSTYQSQNGDVSDASGPINGFNNSIQIEYDAINSLIYKRDFTPTIGTEYTISCFVQMNDNSEPIHTVDVNSGDFCLINNNSLAISSDIKTERLGSTNVYRVSSTRTATSTNNRFGIIKYSTQSSKGFKVTGLQLEVGYPTSYIPTQGSIGTRVADTMPTYQDITKLNIGNSYTLFLDADLNVNDNDKVFSVMNNSSNVTSFTFRNNVGGIRLYNHIDGSYPVSGISSANNKFVIRVDGNSYKVFGQGSSLSGTLTTQRDLGYLNFYGQNTELKINNFTIDDTALSDAECEALVN